jgi:hypothetical protein
MGPSDRLAEAIKQTQIAFEEIDDSDTKKEVEQGLDSLKSGLESYNRSDRSKQ